MPNSNEPWRDAAPAPARPSGEDRRRYERARRLSQFARDLVRMTRNEARYAQQIAYRQQCLDRWQDYLDGWAPAPPTGGGRPPRL